MLPKDLTGFSVEVLKGFSVALDEQLDGLHAAKAEGSFSVDQLTQFESLAEDKIRLSRAIDAALTASAEGDDSEGEEAAPASPAETEEAPAEGEEAEGEEAAPAADPEADVEDAVASAPMGGGSAPRVTREPRDTSDVRSFVRKMVQGGGRVDREERVSFSSMRRETNHVVRAGQNADDAIVAAQRDRAAGSDQTAAGCFCGPDDAVTAIKQCGETVRPLSDTLPTLTASGDIRYVRQIPFADALTGVTEWTCADQADVDPDDMATWKSCFELDCETEITSAMYAVAACARFSTQQLIGNPALIDNLQHVMEVAYNKTAELLVYNRLRALSSAYTYALTTSAGYGASAQLISAVGWAMELIHANLREADPQYTLVLPAGLLDRVLTDGLIRASDDYRTRDDILDRLDTLGIANVIELVDEGGPVAHAALNPPGDPADVAAQHPSTQRIQLYRPEDFVLGVGPDVDLGVTRSPELARQNKLQWFTESFEFVEKVGCAPALDIELDFCPSGVRPAYGDGIDCVIVP